MTTIEMNAKSKALKLLQDFRREKQENGKILYTKIECSKLFY